MARSQTKPQSKGASLEPIPTADDVQKRIAEYERYYGDLLNGFASALEDNPVRTMLQLRVKARLEELYWMLGKVCPTYGFEQHPDFKYQFLREHELQFYRV
jgi:hypothetical protein